MKKRLLIVCIIGAISLLSQQDSARSALNRGVAAFKTARYADAVAAFQEAVRLDPSNVNPHLYLGTAYMVQWTPGGPSEMAYRAESEFKAVLALDPADKTALASLASLSFNMAKASQPDSSERLGHLDAAEAWYRKLAELNPNEKTAFYSLGVIQWERFYPALMAARQELRMRPEDPGPLPDSNSRISLRSKYGSVVENGMANLGRALEIDLQYDNAMAYLNLLYRERADLADSPASYKRDIEAADVLVTRALDARKLKAETAQSSSAPPPPPPPPPGIHTPDRIRVGGNVQAAKLVQKPVPIYPTDAKEARIQGMVRFSVIIAKDGRILDLQLVSGHPLLAPAAFEAVKNWVYSPTLLNGQPVEVITQVDVNFTLSR